MYKHILVSKDTICINGILRIKDNAFIPFDPANTDYQRYLKWLEEGNTPLSADANVQQELFQQE